MLKQRKNETNKLSVESLEKRELKTCDMLGLEVESDGLLAIHGTEHADSVFISQDPGTGRIRVTTRVNVDGDTENCETQFLNSGEIERIEAHLYGEDDTYANSTTIPDYVDAGDGYDEIQGGFSTSEIYGGAGTDHIWGRGGDDILYGGAGRDHLLGGLGDDQLFGESGADRLVGGYGSDYIDPGFDHFLAAHDEVWGDRELGLNFEPDEVGSDTFVVHRHNTYFMGIGGSVVSSNSTTHSEPKDANVEGVLDNVIYSDHDTVLRLFTSIPRPTPGRVPFPIPRF